MTDKNVCGIPQLKDNPESASKKAFKNDVHYRKVTSGRFLDFLKSRSCKAPIDREQTLF